MSTQFNTRLSLLLPLLAAVFFFVTSFLTVNDYGPSWDETLHFSRGQAYLNFFLTGRKDYSNIDFSRKSFYQLDYQNGDFWFKENSGHPPTSDILAAFSNYIFYQKLGILSDIHSYHLFNIAVSSLLVFVVVYFAASSFGLFAAIISYLSLVTYPLFWAEAHFNVKDPPETAFFTATMLSFYLSLRNYSPGWLIISFVFFSLALGTKFNALFIPFIFVLYLLIYIIGEPKKATRPIPKNFLLVLILGPLLIAIIFIGSWPYLWNNFPYSLINVLEYYRRIGTGTIYQPLYFYFHKFNSFPVQWILFTTPPLTLTLSLFGFIAAWIYRKRQNFVSLLWVLWLVIPIIRVSVPGASIYGGIRQILEFLPAMALIAGLGALAIIDLSKKLLRSFGFKSNKYIYGLKILMMLFFLWPAFILFKMHPNQNVYFNFLIGGLKGAEQKNFPAWGNSYGNAYLSAINWINKYAEYGAKVALIQGTRTNTPRILYRSDINLDNANWSGIDRKGEYLIELIFNDTGKAFYYTWEYVDKFLEPVYQLQAEGVPILKIWKNDLEHTKQNYRLFEHLYEKNYKINSEKNTVTVDFKELLILSKVRFSYSDKKGCSKINTSFVETSLDSKNWLREKDWIPFPQVEQKDNLQDNTVTFYFAARKARVVRFVFDDDHSCGLNDPKILFYELSLNEKN